jgi:hypothetical protein
MKAARKAQVTSEPPAHSGRYRRVRDAFSVASDVRLIDTQRQLTLAHQKLAELQEDLHVMSDALELQRQCFDGILQDEKNRAQALVQAANDKLAAAHDMVHRLDDERKRLADERETLIVEHKETLARATQAHFETLSAMRRAYEKRLSDDPEAD